MQHGVVHRRAEHLAERAGAEARVVVDVAGLGPAVADHPVREGVELEQVHPDVGGVLERGQHLGHEAPGGAHPVDLPRRQQLDHGSSLRTGAAARPSGPADADIGSWHGIPLPRQLRPQDLGDHLRQLADPRLAGRERHRHAVRARGPRRRHQHLRHRGRLRQHQGGERPRRGPQGRAARVAGDLHQGLLAHRPGREERHRPVPQAHHGVDRRLAVAAADRLRRPVPGAPLRHRDPARGDDAGVRRRRPPGQGALHRRQRVDRRPDPGGPRAVQGARLPADLLASRSTRCCGA